MMGTNLEMLSRKMQMVRYIVAKKYYHWNSEGRNGETSTLKGQMKCKLDNLMEHTF